jgi:hypothetical protein
LEIAAKRGLVSSRSIENVTGDGGRNACSASASTTSTSRLTRLVSIVRRAGPRCAAGHAPAAEQHVVIE